MLTHWRAVLGWLGAAYGILRAVMDLIGDVDLILDHIPGRDTTWFGKLCAYVITAPGWLVILVVFGGLGLIWWDSRRGRGDIANLLASARHRVAASLPTKPEFEPLPEAARRVLEANLDNLIGEMAMSEPTPDDRLNWFGYWIGVSKEVPLYGKRPPSQRYELIPKERVAQLRFIGGASELHETWTKRAAVYVDLAVKPEDIAAHWQELTS